MVSHESFSVVSAGTIYIDKNEFLPDIDLTLGSDYTEQNGGDYEIVAGSSAFTFCRMLGKLGIDSTFLGVAGDPDDPMGNLLESLVAKEEHVSTYLVRQPGTTTGFSENLTGKNGSHRMRTSGTANRSFNTETILPKLLEASRNASVLYAGGCLKLESFRDGYQQLPELVSDTTRIVVDHGRIPEKLSPEHAEAVKHLVLHASYYLPSKEEFCALWGVSNIEAGVRLLHRQAPNLVVVVKDGKRGAYFYQPDKGMRRIPALPIGKIVNLTGAGDSFNAGFIRAALANKEPVSHAIRKAHVVAANHIQGLPIS